VTAVPKLPAAAYLAAYLRHLGAFAFGPSLLRGRSGQAIFRLLNPVAIALLPRCVRDVVQPAPFFPAVWRTLQAGPDAREDPPALSAAPKRDREGARTRGGPGTRAALPTAVRLPVIVSRPLLTADARQQRDRVRRSH
jgi:hypothetical protein